MPQQQSGPSRGKNAELKDKVSELEGFNNEKDKTRS